MEKDGEIKEKKKDKCFTSWNITMVMSKVPDTNMTYRI